MSRIYASSEEHFAQRLKPNLVARDLFDSSFVYGASIDLTPITYLAIEPVSSTMQGLTGYTFLIV